MFARVLALLPLALLVSAKARLARQGGECNTGTASCCTSTTAGAIRSDSSSSQEMIAAVASLLDSQSAFTSCSSGGLASVLNGCNANQEPVCCNGNTFSGLINIGCSPINIGL